MKLWEAIAAGGAASGLPGFSNAVIDAVKALDDRVEELENLIISHIHDHKDNAVIEGDELPVFRKARKV